MPSPKLKMWTAMVRHWKVARSSNSKQAAKIRDVGKENGLGWTRNRESIEEHHDNEPAKQIANSSSTSEPVTTNGQLHDNIEDISNSRLPVPEGCLDLRIYTEDELERIHEQRQQQKALGGTRGDRGDGFKEWERYKARFKLYLRHKDEFEDWLEERNRRDSRTPDSTREVAPAAKAPVSELPPMPKDSAPAAEPCSVTLTRHPNRSLRSLPADSLTPSRRSERPMSWAGAGHKIVGR